MKIELTKEMINAAHAAYDATVGHAAAMIEALRAALELVPEPVELEPCTVNATVTRQAALERATAIVDAASQPVTNARGYADGWKPPTLEERTTAVLRLAAFMTGTAGEV